MLSVEIIDFLRREEERRRREKEAPARIPVEQPPDQLPPDEESAGASQPTPGSTVVVVDLGRDDGDQFKIATW